MSQHRAALRSYVFSVARELIERGILRQKQGQAISEIVRSEPSLVGKEVAQDLVEVFRELGMTAAFSAAQAGAGLAHQSVDALHRGVDDLASAAGRAVFDFFSGKKKG